MQNEVMDNVHRYFATTVALVTTSGRRYGSNVMAAEWTMQVSYDPMIIAVFLHRSPTYWNIVESKSFGVNIASEEQAELVNIAGGYSGTEIQKFAIPGTFDTYPGKMIKVPMIRKCALNAECKVTKIQKVGDHVMVLGKVLAAKFDDSKLPLIYTRANYRRVSRSKIPSGRRNVRISSEQLARFEGLAQGRFVLKAAACVARSKGRTLLQKFGDDWMVPFVVVKKGENYVQTLERHMRSNCAPASASRISVLSRMNLSDGKTSVRANFVAFRCDAKTLESGGAVRWFDKVPKNTILCKQLLQDA
jgi:flavin reductase (DIM6/NTAB) family NADH-FMN oxidoreductase RutF